MKPTLLLVDDEPGTRISFSRYLSRGGFSIHEVSCLSEAREAISARRFDAVLLDLNLPDGNGLDFIPELKEGQADVAIVVITGVGDIPLAVEAMRRGADHFLTKPVNMIDLEVFLRKSLEVGTLRRRSAVQARLAKREFPLVARSAVMQKMLPLLQLAAQNESSVLLHGETGAGKGVYAKWIHEHGERCDMPLVEVNCSSLRGELLASELFGHLRGAFTSAVETKEGLLDAADGATLFLDEIGDMDLQVQAQFLKVLEDKRYRRLGDVRERQSEFRLLCATNRNLSEDSEHGRMRKDLYFRINVFPIRIPPLRERLEDLPDLIGHLLERLGVPDMKVSPEVMDLFVSYHWPGNVRELRNMLERAVLLAGDRPVLVSEYFAEPNLSSPSNKMLAERRRMKDALQACGGDKAKAAARLRMSRATFYRKLRKAGLQ